MHCSQAQNLRVKLLQPYFLIQNVTDATQCILKQSSIFRYLKCTGLLTPKCTLHKLVFNGVHWVAPLTINHKHWKSTNWFYMYKQPHGKQTNSHCMYCDWSIRRRDGMGPFHYLAGPCSKCVMAVHKRKGDQSWVPRQSFFLFWHWGALNIT